MFLKTVKHIAGVARRRRRKVGRDMAALRVTAGQGLSTVKTHYVLIQLQLICRKSIVSAGGAGKKWRCGSWSCLPQTAFANISFCLAGDVGRGKKGIRRRRPPSAWVSVSWGKSPQPDSESLPGFFFSFFLWIKWQPTRLKVRTCASFTHPCPPPSCHEHNGRATRSVSSHRLDPETHHIF